MGAYHFERFQAERLGRKLRLITMDQRGVLRSAPLADGEPLTLSDVLEDFEALRAAMGIDRWSLIGHSFGGYLALLYAEMYPRRVHLLVLENASLDPASSARSLLAAAALEYGVQGDQSGARACLDLAHAPAETPARRLWAELATRLGGLGSRRNHLYVHGQDKALVEELTASAPFPSEWWRRGGTHQERLVSEGRMFTSLLAGLAQVRQRTLLVKGRYDAVWADDQLHACMRTMPAAELRVFADSSHFVHMEEPESFSDAVTAFLREGA
jgi:proline iminopeptidase